MGSFTEKQRKIKSLNKRDGLEKSKSLIAQEPEEPLR
jgi:hypothetical protein